MKDCIGSLDGTHIFVSLPEQEQVWHIRMTVVATQNMIVICDFDQDSTFALIILSITSVLWFKMPLMGQHWNQHLWQCIDSVIVWEHLPSHCEPSIMNMHNIHIWNYELISLYLVAIYWYFFMYDHSIYLDLFLIKIIYSDQPGLRMAIHPKNIFFLWCEQHSSQTPSSPQCQLNPKLASERVYGLG